MKKFVLLSSVFTLSLMFTGCNKAATTTETDTTIMEPTASPESMMNGAIETPMVQATPADISTDAQLKSTKPVGTSDDPATIKSDLNNTSIVNESFN